MELTPQQVFSRLGQAQIVDVRESLELVDGIIVGARHIPLGDLPHSHDALDKSTPVIAVCRSGRRSAAAAEHLAAAGFTADTMSDGMIGWKEAGLPTVAPFEPDAHGPEGV
jgi:rhodanese-related sulfurtransferase